MLIVEFTTLPENILQMTILAQPNPLVQDDGTIFNWMTNSRHFYQDPVTRMILATAATPEMRPDNNLLYLWGSSKHTPKDRPIKQFSSETILQDFKNRCEQTIKNYNNKYYNTELFDLLTEVYNNA